jgi:hypothetical protein
MRRATGWSATRGFLPLAFLTFACAFTLALGVIAAGGTSSVAAAGTSLDAIAATRDGRAVVPAGVTVDRSAPEWARGAGARAPFHDLTGDPATLACALLATAALLAWLALAASAARRRTRTRVRWLGRAPPPLRFA